MLRWTEHSREADDRPLLGSRFRLFLQKPGRSFFPSSPSACPPRCQSTALSSPLLLTHQSSALRSTVSACLPLNLTRSSPEGDDESSTATALSSLPHQRRRRPLQLPSFSPLVVGEAGNGRCSRRLCCSFSALFAFD